MYEGGYDLLHADGIAFLNKQKLTGLQIFVKFYNTAISSYIVNLAFVSSSSKIFAHFSHGLVTLIDSSDGSVDKAVQISNQFQEAGQWDKTATLFDSATDKIFSGTGFKYTDGGTDYTYNLMSFESDLTAVEDIQIGESFSLEMNGPRQMRMYKSQYLIVGGAVYESSIDAAYPRGSVLAFDKDDIGAGVRGSIKFASLNDF